MTPDLPDPIGKPEVTGLQLLAKAEAQGLQEELVRQLNKDMSMSGVEASIEEGLEAEEIVSRLKNILKELIRDDFQGYLNLLYRVDVPQSRMVASPETDFTQYVERSTYELLKREWQKVWIRNKIQ